MISQNIRSDFPILQREPKLAYFDNACTTLKPKQVIEAELLYYQEYGACGGRSYHALGRKTNEKLEECRATVAGFVGAKAENLVWVKNTTEALNLVIQSLDYAKKNKVITTVLEHHSVLLPLMKLRDEKKIKLEILPCDRDGEVDWKNNDAFDKDTALVVTHSCTNTTGMRQDVRKITRLAHQAGALVCIDGAQGVPHYATQFARDETDFLCFSAHKMLGPTGIGALVAKKEALATLKDFVVGGGTVKSVSLERVEKLTDQTRFEAGIQNYAGIFGFAGACDYLKKIGMQNVEEHEKKLAQALHHELINASATILGEANESKANNSHSTHSALY